MNLLLRLFWTAASIVRYAFATYVVLLVTLEPGSLPLSVVEPFLFWLCLPSFVLLILDLARRRWPAALAHAAIATVWTFEFGHLLIPPSPPPPPRGPTLELLSFNVGCGVAPYARIVELLRREDADVVMIQELTADQERAFANDLLELYPHRDLHGLGFDGLAVFSKLPILESKIFRLGARRPFQRSVIDFHGARTTLFNAHPDFHRLMRRGPSHEANDVERLAGMARDAKSAMIVGDLNATENMDICRSIEAAGLRDAFREAGRGFGMTFPVFGTYRGWPIPPVIRIDFVWHTPDWFCREARVLENAGSDHLPLSVVLERR